MIKNFDHREEVSGDMVLKIVLTREDPEKIFKEVCKEHSSFVNL